MTRKLKKILDQYTGKVQELYPGALKAIILYGSYARGDNTKNSDIDIMILVDLSDEQICSQREMLSNMTYDFNEEYNLDIKPMMIGLRQYEYWLPVYPFYQNIEKDGVKIYAA